MEVLVQHASILIPTTLSLIISQCVFNVKPSSLFDVGSIWVQCRPISGLTAELEKKKNRMEKVMLHLQT